MKRNALRIIPGQVDVLRGVLAQVASEHHHPIVQIHQSIALLSEDLQSNQSILTNHGFDSNRIKFLRVVPLLLGDLLALLLQSLAFCTESLLFCTKLFRLS